MRIETKIKLDKFQPRPYQLPVIRALEEKKFRKIICIWPRRAGKDIVAFNLIIRAALDKIAVYFYVFPTYAQGKKALFQSITIDSIQFLDFIPRELVESINSQEMKIKLINGSLIQVVGSDNIDSLLGSNPYGVVFSEYALQSPKAYQFIRPILAANGGFAIFVSTPRGKNHLFELFQIALHNPESWFVSKLTLDDTQHIPLFEIEREKAEGVMSDDLIQQEYYTSWDLGVEGSYYSKYLDRMRVRGAIGDVPWENSAKVHTAWDLGMRDSTTIIFFQTIGQTVRLVDTYENTGHGLDHYVKVLQQKPYTYGKHIAPHDIKVRELGTGMSRLEKARTLGLSFTVAPDLSIEDGIEAVRSSMSKIWVDAVNCKNLIKALENYRHEYDAQKKVYKGNPLHDWSSHFCFSGETKILTRNGMRQIMDVQENDEVLTLRGWKKCTQAKITKKNAEIVEVIFQDGTKVKCTPDHLFLTENGWFHAIDLVRGTKILSSLMSLHNILMGHCTVSGQAKFISQKVARGYTAMFGKMLLEKFRRTVTFIIEIIKPPIIIFGTWNVFPKKFIGSFQGQIIRDLLEKRERQLHNGIDQKQVDCGINDKRIDLKVGLNGLENRGFAFTVKKNLNVLLEKMGIRKNSVTRTAKHLIIERVNYLPFDICDVWDIEVPEAGHFSLSNGAIVHNSDAMRYLCISLPKTADGLSPEDLERRYQEAMGGSQSNMPRMFRDDIPKY